MESGPKSLDEIKADLMALTGDGGTNLKDPRILDDFVQNKLAPYLVGLADNGQQEVAEAIEKGFVDFMQNRRNGK